MGVITTGTHPKLYWPGVKLNWGQKYNEHVKEYPDLFDMDTSSMKYEELVKHTSFPLANVKNEASPTTYVEDAQGFTTRFTHVAYSLGYICTREEIDDNLYPIVGKRRSTGLAFSANQTKENVAANFYNRAFNASYVFGDGVEMISAAHPSSAGNQSNILTVAADFSEQALEDLTIQIMGATNDQGMKIALMPKSLHVPRQLFYKAHRVLMTIQQTGTANNDLNIIKAQNVIPGGVKVNHYFSSAKAWFVRTNLPEGGLIGFQRTPIEFTKDNDFDTENAKAKFYERYSFGMGDFLAIFGSPGI